MSGLGLRAAKAKAEAEEAEANRGSLTNHAMRQQQQQPSGRQKRLKNEVIMGTGPVTYGQG